MKCLIDLCGEVFVSFVAVRRLGAICLLLLAGGAVLIEQPSAVAQGNDKTISTLVGGGFDSSVPARQAPMVQPTLVARDPQGRGIYIVDFINGSALLRFLNTSAATVTLAGVPIGSGRIGRIAGGGTLDPVDGNPIRQVDLGQISGITVDPSGDVVYFGITGFFRAIYGINVTTQNFNFQGRNIAPGILTSLTSVNLADFWSLVLTPDRRFLINGMPNTGVPRVYRVSSGDIEVIAGGGTPPEGSNGDGGPATQARIVKPTGLALDSEGSLLIAEGGTGRDLGALRKVTTDGTISTLVPELEFPIGVSIAPNGNIYVPLGNAQRILQTSSSGGSTTFVAGDSSKTACNFEANPTCGDGGPALSARFSFPGSASEIFYTQIAVDASGIIIPDFRYPHVRYVNLSANPVTLAGTTIAPQQINKIVGSGEPEPYNNVQAEFTELFSPHGVASDAQGNLFISDTDKGSLRFVNRGTAAVTLFSGTPSQQTVQPGVITTLNNNAPNVEGDHITIAFFNSLQGLFTVSNGIYIVDALNGLRYPGGIQSPASGLVRFLNTSSSNVTLFPGSATPIVVPPGQIKIVAGQRPAAGVNPDNIGDGMLGTKAVVFPNDVVVDGAGNIYISDYGNDRIRRVDGNTGVISSLLTGLNRPAGVALDGAGRLLVADTYNNRILRQNAPGSAEFSNIADGSLQAPNRPIQRPRDLVVGGDGKIYITNGGGNQILQLEAPANSLGTTSVLAGTGVAGFGGDGGPASQASIFLPNPQNESNVVVTANITFLPDGSLIFTDTNNDRIRRITLSAPVGAVATVSAASFAQGTDIAAESIVAAFGSNLATGFAVPDGPLPEVLLETTVKVRDSAGAERLSKLFFVAGTQVNFQIPPGTALGPATITIQSGNGSVSVGTVQIANVAPGIFAANANGAGVASAQSLRIKAGDPTLYYESTAQLSGQSFIPLPINLGPETDQVFLILYGTGIRFNGGLPNVSVMIGNQTFPALYADVAPGFTGLDQINVGPLPRTMIGAGVLDVKVTVAGKTANTVTIQIQ